MLTINAADGMLNKLSSRVISILGWVLVLLFAALGLSTGHRIGLGVFYLLPISIVSWYGSRRQGVVIALASVLALFADDIFSLHRSIASFSLYWDSFGRLVPFLMIACVLPALKNALRLELEFAREDPLTGIANKHAFYDIALRETQRARRERHEFTVAYIDIDNFKTVNGTPGHPAGDSLLIAAAKTISVSIRSIDIAARLGGDEFIIMLPKASYAEAGEIINRIRGNFNEQMNKNGWNATISVGAVTYRRFHNPVDIIIEETSALARRVKNSGKNGVIHEIVQ